MTGGGTGRCLQTTEAGGMGEGILPFNQIPRNVLLIETHSKYAGWSDAMAEWVKPSFHSGSFLLTFFS